MGWELVIEGIPIYNEKAYCASGTLAFNVAYIWLLREASTT